MATVNKYEQWFNTVDKDGSGKLSFNELKDYLVGTRGYTEQQVRGMFDQLDCSIQCDGEITLEEYITFMTSASPQNHSASAMRTVCKGFDKDGNGTIDKDELKAVFEELGRNLPEDELERLMTMVDTDRDGSIDYNELCVKVFGQECG